MTRKLVGIMNGSQCESIDDAAEEAGCKVTYTDFHTTATVTGTKKQIALFEKIFYGE